MRERIKEDVREGRKEEKLRTEKRENGENKIRGR